MSVVGSGGRFEVSTTQLPDNYEVMKFYENKVASRQECKLFDYMFINKIREVLRSKDICTETEEATTTRHDENKVQQDRNNGQLSSNYRLLLVKLILHFWACTKIDFDQSKNVESTEGVQG